MILNWFGRKAHYTDQWITWRDKDPKVTSQRLRSAWDKIEEAGLQKEVKLLIEAARDEAKQSCWDDEAGSSL